MNNYGYKDWVDIKNLSSTEAYKKYIKSIKKDRKFLSENLVAVLKMIFDLQDLISYYDKFGHIIEAYSCYKKGEDPLRNVAKYYETDYIKNKNFEFDQENFYYIFTKKIHSIKHELDLNIGCLRGWYERWLSLNDNHDFDKDPITDIISKPANFSCWGMYVQDFCNWVLPKIESMLILSYKKHHNRRK